MPRKKPYSGKQKKLQLKIKRDRKAAEPPGEYGREKRQTTSVPQQCSSSDEDVRSLTDAHEKKEVQLRTYDPERYKLSFLRESREQIEQRKLSSQTKILEFVTEEEMETSIEEIFVPGSELDMPQRPMWKYGISKANLDKNENEYFSKYLDDIHTNFHGKHLSYFEHNLETWRQLWRVLEMSDIICIVADIRHPILHFSPALYNYVDQTIDKPVVLILNKIDLVGASVVVAWREYFMTRFPRLNVVCFSSFPRDVRNPDGTGRTRRGIRKRVYATWIGPRELLRVCKNVCREKVNLTSWCEKIENDCLQLQEVISKISQVGLTYKMSSDANMDVISNEGKFKDGQLTIGFVGHPNVGKSSVMNSLVGKKVVSTSVTPGHTKYFQTYFLTDTVMLCDCPGLVFPSLIPKQMQILSGIYPISQVQEPYTPVGYLAERIPLVKILKLQHPDHEQGAISESKWTAWDICEVWAIKRGYFTAKASRPDVYRAANSILRMAVDGRLCMVMIPPEYIKNREKWNQHPETKMFSMMMNKEKPQSDHSSGDHGAEDNPFDSEIDLSASCSEDSDSVCEDDETGSLSTGNKFSILSDV